MPNYHVYMKLRFDVDIVVEADSEEEAIQTARDNYNEGEWQFSDLEDDGIEETTAEADITKEDVGE